MWRLGSIESIDRQQSRHRETDKQETDKMSKQQALNLVKAMAVKSNSVTVNDNFVVVHPSKKVWRLGELCGDWITSGTAEEVIETAYA
jgi:hypothetical protein